MKKAHLRLWSALDDYGFGHPSRNGRLWRLDGTDRAPRAQSRRTKKALRRMASVAVSNVAMAPQERERRALAFAAHLTRLERDAAMRRLFGPQTMTHGWQR